MISDIKWQNGYACRECGCKDFYLIKRNYARRCKNKKCNYEESAILNTAFADSKIPVHVKVDILLWVQYNISDTARRMPIAKLAKDYDINENTISLFFNKIYKFINIKKGDEADMFENVPRRYYRGLTVQKANVYACLYELLMDDTLPHTEKFILTRLVSGEELRWDDDY